MKTLSLDLRKRIVDSYDAEAATRQEIADRYRVSLGMVKKLLAQRKRLGEIGNLHRHAGRKAYFDSGRQHRIFSLVKDQPDVTLEEIRARLNLSCTLPAIHYVLKAMNLTFKKNPTRQRARQTRRCVGSLPMDRRAKRTR